MKRKLYPFIALILIAGVTTFYFNAGYISEQEGIYEYLYEVDPIPDEYLQRIPIENVKEVKVYEFTPPTDPLDFLKFRDHSINFFGKDLRIVVQSAKGDLQESSFYLGYIFPENSNAYQGYVTASYYRGFINGSINYGKTSGKLIPLDRNIFAIIEYEKKPEFQCATTDHSQEEIEDTSSSSLDHEDSSDPTQGQENSINHYDIGTSITSESDISNPSQDVSTDMNIDSEDGNSFDINNNTGNGASSVINKKSGSRRNKKKQRRFR